MKSHLSVVIISSNAERTLEKCLVSIHHLTDDIVIVDAHSKDRTTAIAKKYGCQVFDKEWTGYGDARNYGASKAKYDWIFAIDTDEEVSPTLFRSIQNAPLETGYSFLFNRVNFIGERSFKFGELAPEWKERIYHKELAHWNNAPVHEQLVQKSANQKSQIEGVLLHYAYESIHDMKSRYYQYAALAKEHNPVLQFAAPSYHLFKSYFLKMGFLEGQMGWDTAKIRYNYTQLKYAE